MSDLKLYFLLLFGILLLCSSVLFFFRYFYKRGARKSKINLFMRDKDIKVKVSQK